jgi:putative ABC transport system permease protein
MFNLSQAISQWKRKLQSEGSLEDGDTQEIISHLEDRIDALTAQGMSEQDAFNQGVRETGDPTVLGAQHRIARERKSWQVTRTFLPALLVSYLKVMVRQFGRYRTHNWITIGGLAIGLASCLFITIYTLHELSYDRDYADRPIYRVVHHHITSQGVEGLSADGPIPLGPALKDEFPEIKNVVRFWRAYMPVIRANGKIFQENNFIFADTAVFRVFDFKLTQGNAGSVFAAKNSIAISESMARKYFGDGDALGNTLEYQGYPGDNISFIVTGIFKDLPGNTHFNFDCLASFNAMRLPDDRWGSFKPIWTYVELDNAVAAANLSPRLSLIVDKYLADRKNDGSEMSFRLEPIASIYLNSGAGGMKSGGNITLINIVVFTGILILIMSCVNFINISLAKMTVRLKEVGMRKVFGAIHRQVVFQFVTEVAMTFVISMLFAAVIAALCSPLFVEVTGMNLHLQEILDWRFLSVLSAVFLFVVIIAGYVPARTVSGFTIQQSFGKGSERSDRRFSARSILIFFQVAISGMLIISALVVNDQLKFIESKDLGVDIENVVAIPFSEKSEAFDSRLRAISGVESVSSSQRLPVNTLNYDRTIVSTPGIEGVIPVESSYITPDFLDTYRVRLLAGRNFDSHLVSDSNKFIINETAMHVLGWDFDNAIGRKLTWATTLQGEVVGVVGDYHLESVHAVIQPMVMLNAVQINNSWQRNFISIRLRTQDTESATVAIGKLWREFNPQGAYQIFFMKDSYEQLHKSDSIFSMMIFYFTIVAIFISAIGLYAVSSYAAEQKRKEIGIRKVLGSGIGSITWKLAAPYVVTTLLSLTIVVPAVYYLMTRWLMTFAYATAIHWYTILLSVAIIIALTLVSVLKESLRAAVVNPVKFLREE